MIIVIGRLVIDTIAYSLVTCLNLNMFVVDNSHWEEH